MPDAGRRACSAGYCVAPAGGPSPHGTRWVPGRADFFLPVRVLSRVLRGKFVELLKAARRQGKLRFHGGLQAAGRARRHGAAPGRVGPTKFGD